MFEYLNVLNENQKKAATTIEGPLLIIAGAGSGKTTVLVNRLAYMVEKGISPENILMLTFTNKAANNMIERANSLVDERCKDITACTYHSFCAKILRTYGKYIGLANTFSILAPTEEADALKYIKSFNKEKYNVRGFPSNSTVLQIQSKAINTQKPLREILYNLYEKYRDYEYLINDLLEEYDIYKEKNNILNYDDLMIKTLELLQNESIRSKLDSAYKYIMVDEYQDTNSLQEKILFLLCRDYNNLAVVGDDYQSIYAFRGSDINNILNFPSKMPGCQQVTIDVNYRSTREILNVANQIMIDHADFGYPKVMKDNNKNGDKVVLKRTENDIGQTSFICNKILDLKNKGVPLSKIAILERSSNHSADIELNLNKQNIPFNKLGGLKFMEYECVLDMMAYLRAFVNPLDQLAWFRVLDSIPGIGDTYANQILSRQKEPNFLIHKSLEKRKFYQFLKELNDRFANVKYTDTLEIQYQKLADTYFYFKEKKTTLAKVEDESVRTTMFETIESEKTLLKTLKDILLKYESIIQFLDSVTLDANVNNETDDVLTISTIHSAKGLEWDYVFIVNCMEGVFPCYTKEKSSDFYEELRCFYVAITRAREKLWLMSPTSLKLYGRSFAGKIPMFLSGCGPYIDGGFSSDNTIKPMGISFQLVPQSLWGKNLHTVLSANEWTIIKRNVTKSKFCACCGASSFELDAHEIWEYDDINHIQNLKQIIPVCKNCHNTIHIGFANVQGILDECMAWYQKVNHLSEDDMYKDYYDACDLWNKRNEYEWTQKIDKSLLDAYLYSEERPLDKKDPSKQKHYLHVPYSEKDIAKKLGAKWDPNMKSWYYIGEYKACFKKWI